MPRPEVFLSYTSVDRESVKAIALQLVSVQGGSGAGFRSLSEVGRRKDRQDLPGMINTAPWTRGIKRLPS